MQHMTRWRVFLNEVSKVPKNLKSSLESAILQSNFWSQPNSVDDIDAVDDSSYQMGTPATEALERSLNQAAADAGAPDLHFEVSSGDEEYALGPDDPYGKYPDNWMMRGQYRGPYQELDGKHVVWLEIRPLTSEFNFDEFNSGTLAATISTTINHELVHYYQLKKQAQSKGLSDWDAYKEMVCDPKQTPVGDPDRYREVCGKEPPTQKGSEREIYLSRHGEIDAFAYEAAEKLLRQYKDPQKAAEEIGSPSNDVLADYAEVFKDNPKILKKFRTKVYNQIIKQAEENDV